MDFTSCETALYRMNPGLTLSVGLRQGEDKVAG